MLVYYKPVKISEILHSQYLLHMNVLYFLLCFFHEANKLEVSGKYFSKDPFMYM